MDPAITSVQVRVSIDARIKNFCQHLRERIAYSETASSKSHVIRELLILSKAFRVTPNVIPQVMIILGKRLGQILGEKQCIVIPKHEPPHVGVVEGDGLLYNTGDTYS